MLLAVGVMLTGCVRVHAAFSVSTDDQVSGELIAGAQPSAQAGQTATATVPPTLAGKVTSVAYDKDGYTGTDLTFRNLSFAELSSLASSISAGAGHYQITFNRAGDLVSVTGSVDLSEVPASGLDVQIKVSFPGTVLRTDGTQSSSGGVSTVSWTPKAGRVTGFSATARYTVGATHTWGFWAAMLGLGGALVAGFLLWLALLARRRQLRKEARDVAVYS
ncbi:MAG TPA: DUF3153 domain-containing protein [Pseudonocardiaceae bacterium]|nr:DUF3153 domain-containing protein [Pseudonocardiaceae bacterium]